MRGVRAFGRLGMNRHWLKHDRRKNIGRRAPSDISIRIKYNERRDDGERSFVLPIQKRRKTDESAGPPDDDDGFVHWRNSIKLLQA